METKSRYEVIAGLEEQKRELIQQRDSLKYGLAQKEKMIKDLQRQKDDNIRLLDRKIEDAIADKEEYEGSMDEQKITITELIKSVDESLERLGALSKPSNS